jgi:hypothetical protein
MSRLCADHSVTGSQLNAEMVLCWCCGLTGCPLKRVSVTAVWLAVYQNVIHVLDAFKFTHRLQHTQSLHSDQCSQSMPVFNHCWHTAAAV